MLVRIFLFMQTGNYGYFLEPSDTLEWFPGVSVVYMRLPWVFIEPEEGKFNFGVLDTPAQRFIDKGKQIAIRITCTEHWIPWATPKWVKDKGAKEHNPHTKRPSARRSMLGTRLSRSSFLNILDRMVGKLAEGTTAIRMSPSLTSALSGSMGRRAYGLHKKAQCPRKPCGCKKTHRHI